MELDIGRNLATVALFLSILGVEACEMEITLNMNILIPKLGTYYTEVDLFVG